MVGIIIAILSAIFMFGWQIFLKQSHTEELNPSVSFFFDMIFGLLIWIPIGFIFGATGSEIVKNLPIAFVSAILSEAFVFYALTKGNLSVASALIATYPIFTLMFSFVINNEFLTPIQLACIILTIIGIIMTCIEKDFKLKSLKNVVIIIPLLAAISIGLADTLSKRTIDATSVYSFLVAIALCQIPVAIGYLLITKQKVKEITLDAKKDIQKYKLGLIAAIFNIVATGLLYVSFSFNLASICSPLTAMSTPFIVLYSLIILKEKIHITNKIGIVISLIGTLGIIIIGE